MVTANEAFERVASIGLQSNMIMYLTREYNLEATTAAYILFVWSAVSNLMPVLGAFVADSYAGRYRMVGFGSVATLAVISSISLLHHHNGKWVPTQTLMKLLWYPLSLKSWLSYPYIRGRVWFNGQNVILLLYTLHNKVNISYMVNSIKKIKFFFFFLISFSPELVNSHKRTYKTHFSPKSHLLTN